jgi:prolyl 4-hydroxylase
MGTSLNIEWASWAAENTALGVPAEVIKAQMLQAGMDAVEVQELLDRIKKLPGYTALERMTQKYNDAKAQIDALKAQVGSAVNPIPSIKADSKSTFIIEGHQFTIQAIFKTPNIVLFSNFLSPTECATLIALSTPKLTPSMGMALDTGASELSNSRTSHGTFFHRAENDTVTRIEDRISKVLNFPVTHGEGLQVLKYDVGQQYLPHYDYFIDEAKATRPGGPRVGTLLMYLNTPDAGGATTFPNLGLDIQPVAGNAVFFSYPDDTDISTLHGGNPVIAGEKWVATKWIRTQSV